MVGFEPTTPTLRKLPRRLPPTSAKGQARSQPSRLFRQPVGRWTDCSRRRWRVVKQLALIGRPPPLFIPARRVPPTLSQPEWRPRFAWLTAPPHPHPRRHRRPAPWPSGPTAGTDRPGRFPSACLPVFGAFVLPPFRRCRANLRIVLFVLP